MGKKRKFEEEDEDDSNHYLTTTNGYLPHNESFRKNYTDQFNQFRSTLCLNEEIEFNSFKKLYDFFKMNVAKPKFMSQIGPLCDIKFITNILWRYNCTLSQKDLLIFDLLNLLENQMYLDFSLISPIVFGERSKKYYEDLVKYGHILHRKLTSEQVLEYYDQKIMWVTLTKMTRFHHKKSKENRRVIKIDEKCYDPRFVLRSLLQIVKMDKKFNCKTMVASNALSFCFASTSFYDETLRSLAYSFLQHFQRKLQQRNERFHQKMLFTFFIDFFKNSISTINQRVSPFVSQFFARYSKIALTPINSLYSPLTSFFIQKPSMDLESIPEFYKLFFSSSCEHFKDERRWILRLIDDSILDSKDYQALGKVHAIESFMSIFCTPMADLWNKLLLIKIFRSCVELQAKDLFMRLNFDIWLANAILHSRTTIMEKLELSSIFLEMINQLKKGGFDEYKDTKQENGSKIIENSERRKMLLLTKLKINTKKVIEYLKNDLRFDIERDINKRDEIINLLQNNELIKF